MLKEFSISSSLSGYQPSINASYDDESGIVKIDLEPYEIMQLHRRLPMHPRDSHGHEYHDHELTATTQFFITLAECMKHAQKQKWEIEEQIHKEETSAASVQEKARQTDPELAITTIDKKNNPTLKALDDELQMWKSRMEFYHRLFPVLDALADLEELLNRADKTHVDLQNTLIEYKAKINALVATLTNAESINELVNETNKDLYTKQVNDFQTAIIADLEGFSKNITRQKNTDKVSPEDTQALFSNPIINDTIIPLGSFVIEQVKRATSVVSLYIRLHEHFPGMEDYIEKSHDAQRLDVLKDDRFAALQSIANIPTSTRKPIPEETIAVLRIAGGNTSQCKRSWVRLNDFLKPSEKTDLNAWEKVLCHISGKSPHIVGDKNYLHAAGFIIGVSLFATLETAFTIATRFPSEILTGLLLGTLPKFALAVPALCASKDWTTNKNEAIDSLLLSCDQTIDNYYNKLSGEWYLTGGGLTHLRKCRDTLQQARYQAIVLEDGEIPDQKTDLLLKITSAPKSSLSFAASRMITATSVSKTIENGLKSVDNFGRDTLINPGYLSVKKTTSKEALKKRYDDLFVELIAILEKEMVTSGDSLAIQAIARLRIMAGDKTEAMEFNTIDGLALTMSTPVAQSPDFISIQPSIVEPSQSMIDFFQELSLEFSKLINGVLIKAPLSTMVSMLFAVTSFAATYEGFGGPLPIILDTISKSFTGEEASISEFRMMLASFLEWKLGTLLIEGLMAAGKLDPHFLEKLYTDPERIILGLSTFVSLGFSLAYAPTLPVYLTFLKVLMVQTYNYYFAFLNVFKHESTIAAKGQIPLNGLEFFFLGLKLVFIIGTLFAGLHKALLKRNETHLKAIIENLTDIDDLVEDQHQAAVYIAQLSDALGLDIPRNSARHFFDFLSEDKNTNPELLKDLFNQYIDKGSNNALQIIALYPFYKYTLAYRASVYALACWIDSPVIKHAVMKSFANNAMMMIQFLASMSEPARTFLFSVNQLCRSLVAVVAAVTFGMGHLAMIAIRRCFPGAKVDYNFNSFNEDWISGIDIHNNVFWLPKVLLTPACDDSNPYNVNTSLGANWYTFTSAASLGTVPLARLALTVVSSLLNYLLSYAPETQKKFHATSFKTLYAGLSHTSSMASDLYSSANAELARDKTLEHLVSDNGSAVAAPTNTVMDRSTAGTSNSVSNGSCDGCGSVNCVDCAACCGAVASCLNNC